MKPAALPLFLVALCVHAGAAFAQGAPPATAAVAVEADTLEPPPLPVVPPAMRASVDALGETVSNTNECYTVDGERVSHTADPNCPQWYARLARSGLAGVYAIGAAFRPVQSDAAWKSSRRQASAAWTCTSPASVPPWRSSPATGP